MEYTAQSGNKENEIALPLEGIRVIELATVVAAPTAGRALIFTAE